MDNPEMSLLNPLELDALTELLNIGVNRAAGSLRKMVGHPIMLTVPAVKMMTVDDATTLAWNAGDLALIAVSQAFDGPFAGKAFLIFSERSGSSFVALLAGEMMSGDALLRFEDEALGETANVVLNACLGSVGNMLRERIHLAAPVVTRSEGRGIADSLGASGDEVVLLLYISFGVARHDITGYVALVLDQQSLHALQAIIAAFLDRAK
jgi:chemotaxis protein CheC